jgi:hypothetical protein
MIPIPLLDAVCKESITSGQSLESCSDLVVAAILSASMAKPIVAKNANRLRPTTPKLS